MKNLHDFKNLIDLLTYFKDEGVCSEYLARLRWQDTLTCPFKECGSTHIHKCANNKYKCYKCKNIYSVRVGTMFEDSRLPLQKWFAAIYLVTAHKKGISSLQLHRDIGVTQKTAWFMLHRIRHTLGLPNNERVSGGNEKNKHAHKKIDNAQGRSVKGKSAVAGVVKRGGELRANKVKDTSGYNLRTFVNKNVEHGSTVNTDEWGGYSGLSRLFFHKQINHLEGKYVDGDTHTNTIESFWSLLKRGIYGIYHSVSPKHLQNYVDEFVFRYNTRQSKESNRFALFLANSTKHLTYKQLTSHDNTGSNNQTSSQPNLSGF